MTVISITATIVDPIFPVQRFRVQGPTFLLLAKLWGYGGEAPAATWVYGYGGDFLSQASPALSKSDISVRFHATY